MLPIGTISEGTTRNQDLIPALLFALEEQDQAAAARFNSELAALGFGYSQCGVCFDDDSPLWDTEAETLTEIRDELETALQEYAPAFCYVGSHPRDGANIGCWMDHYALDNALYDDELAGVSDPAELDALDTDQSQAVFVNDHGNTTLYARDESGAWVIVWDCV